MQTLQPKETRPEEPNAHSLHPADLAVTSRGKTWANIRLIIIREYLARVRRRLFVITTALMLVLVIAASFIPTLIQYFSSTSLTKIAVVNNVGTVNGQDVVSYLDQSLNLISVSNNVAAPATANQKPTYEVTSIDASAAADYRGRVQNGNLDALLTISRQSSGELNFDYYTKNSATGTDEVRLQQVLTVLSINDRLSRAGLPQSQVAQLFTPASIKAISTNQEKSNGQSDAERAASYLLAFFLVVILFTTIYGYGVAVAQGAAEEKSNRVMEIMISAATPFQLMMGKVIGIGLAGFTQVAILVGGGILAFLVQNPIKDALLGNKSGGTTLDITKVSVSALAFFLVFYVLGFMLWATLYAAVGSLVSRQEDVQGALTPMTYLSMSGYIAAIFALQSIDAPWVAILSYFPFFTPMLMFARLALGNASWVEGLIAVVLLIVSAIIFAWLSSKVYRAGVLQYGRKPSFGQFLKLMWRKG